FHQPVVRRKAITLGDAGPDLRLQLDHIIAARPAGTLVRDTLGDGDHALAPRRERAAPFAADEHESRRALLDGEPVDVQLRAERDFVGETAHERASVSATRAGAG